MWAVFERKSVDKALRKAPRQILIRFEAWKRVVELTGPKGLGAVKGFRDEALEGPWRGHRSSRWGEQWRVVYKVVKSKFEVRVIEVNPHEYQARQEQVGCPSAVAGARCHDSRGDAPDAA